MATFPLLDRIPAQTVGAAQLQRLRAFATAHNTLIVLHPQTGSPLVYQPALSGFLDTYFPASFAQAGLARLRLEFGNDLTSEEGLQPVEWLRLSQHGAPVSPPSDANLNTTGLGPAPEPGQVETWFHGNYASLLQVGSELSRAQLSGLINQMSEQPATEAVMTPESTTAGFWNCLVRHLGLWGAVAVFSALGAAIIILTGTGGITLPLIIWLVASFGGGTAGIIINCAINNSW
jgi:hypothetical protein